MYGIRVNSSAVDSPNNSLIKQKGKQGHNRLGGGGGGDYKLHLQDMREGKLCPETLSSWCDSEYIMLQSLLLLFIDKFSFNIASKTFQKLQAIFFLRVMLIQRESH